MTDGLGQAVSAASSPYGGTVPPEKLQALNPDEGLGAFEGVVSDLRERCSLVEKQLHELRAKLSPVIAEDDSVAPGFDPPPHGPTAQTPVHRALDNVMDQLDHLSRTVARITQTVQV